MIFSDSALACATVVGFIQGVGSTFCVGVTGVVGATGAGVVAGVTTQLASKVAPFGVSVLHLSFITLRVFARFCASPHRLFTVCCVCVAVGTGATGGVATGGVFTGDTGVGVGVIAGATHAIGALIIGVGARDCLASTPVAFGLVFCNSFFFAIIS